MELFTQYFDLLLFYMEPCFGFWIKWILKKENPKIESFPPLADLALDNIYIYIHTGWNDKIVVLKKTTLQLYFKTFIEKINSGNLIM